MEAESYDSLFVHTIFSYVQFLSPRSCILDLLNPSYGVAKLPLEQLSMSEDFIKRHAFEVWLKAEGRAGLPRKLFLHKKNTNKGREKDENL